jgi:N-methylhydantoinase B
MFEVAVPVLTERKELIADSGGAGKHRGGLGQRVVLRNLGKNPMNIYLASERVRHPCFGVVEGQSGSAGKVMKDGKPQFPKGKVVLKTGQRLEVETPGGGGWGPASDRSPALIEQDLSENLITAKAAKEIYGYSGPLAAAAE